MTDSDRREFLKRAAAAAAVGIGGAKVASGSPAEPKTDEQSATPPAGARATTTQGASAATATLQAIGGAVLPTAVLGDDGVARVVGEFEAWIEAFEPAAELPHGYLNRGLAEIRYGPPHPGPRWASQIEALEREAERRHGSSFAALDLQQQRALIEGQLERDEIGRLPDPAEARHVAIGLLAFFYDSSAATDLCYDAAIGRFRCRGLSNAGRPPRPLPDSR